MHESIENIDLLFEKMTYADGGLSGACSSFFQHRQLDAVSNQDALR